MLRGAASQRHDFEWLYWCEAFQLRMKCLAVNYNHHRYWTAAPDSREATVERFGGDSTMQYGGMP